MHVGHAFAHRPPSLLRVLGRFTVNTELIRLIDRRLCSQHAALLVEHFQAVAGRRVFDSHAFRAPPIARHALLLKFSMHATLRRNLPAKETKHIPAAELLDAMPDQPGVDLRQGIR